MFVGFFVLAFDGSDIQDPNPIGFNIQTHLISLTIYLFSSNSTYPIQNQMRHFSVFMF